ncbi:hypothetical protein PR002_g29335 [Phytophthora rubi]|uniref:Uncharacterized protein n=1 Tax=Phytophthora rubi TaxID=129364 RepID=A0A6A3H2I3_9STRA|nr:hypothetical protein PR002_g29335 [Phytophthora rubi]
MWPKVWATACSARTPLDRATVAMHRAKMLLLLTMTEGCLCCRGVSSWCEWSSTE